MRAIVVVIALWAMADAGTSAVSASAHDPDDSTLRCTAGAISAGGPRTAPVATSVDVVVDRWSSEGERQRLLEALKSGQDALLETLRDLPRVGYIRTPDRLGWDLHFAQRASVDGKTRRVVIATDRPIGFWETVYRPRTINYPFTFIEMQLDNRGRGEGKLSLATRVISSDDGSFVELENYATQPIQLNGVECR